MSVVIMKVHCVHCVGPQNDSSSFLKNPLKLYRKNIHQHTAATTPSLSIMPQILYIHQSGGEVEIPDVPVVSSKAKN